MTLIAGRNFDGLAQAYRKHAATKLAWPQGK